MYGKFDIQTTMYINQPFELMIWISTKFLTTQWTSVLYHVTINISLFTISSLKWFSGTIKQQWYLYIRGNLFEIYRTITKLATNVNCNILKYHTKCQASHIIN